VYGAHACCKSFAQPRGLRTAATSFGLARRDTINELLGQALQFLETDARAL
jgi:hypothetical protein